MTNPKIEEAQRTLKVADHMIYVSYPLIKEGRLLIKALEEIGKAIEACIKYVLDEKDYVDSKTHFEDFIKASQKYNISEIQINKIKTVLEFVERRRKSPMEFSREGKAVIMHNDLNTESVTTELLKDYIETAKELLKKLEIPEKNP